MSKGLAIKRLRKIKNMKQKQLAIACGIPFSTMCSYERDRFNPGEDVIEKICKALDCSRLFFAIQEHRDEIPKEKLAEFDEFIKPIEQLLKK